MATSSALAGLKTAGGDQIALGERLGAGGEGMVFSCPRRPLDVVKVYKERMSPERQVKLRDMAVLADRLPEDFKAIAAWPTEVVVQGRDVVGFIMPRVSRAEEIHILYGPKCRKQKFPAAGFKFLVHVAMNVARAFHVLHRENIVIGDVNERQVMVGHTGTVHVIDCDSFQFKGQAQEHFCDVGVAYYTPPELQQLSLRGLRRTTQHDAFGLAVLIFHILFLGRHPFAGRYLKQQEMPLEKAIEECRFAYSPDVSRTQMAAPPNTPPLEMPGKTVAGQFELAFSPSAARGQLQRPSAQEWADALQTLLANLVTCRENAAHAYIASSNVCPWCQVEATTRFELFNYVEPTGAAHIPVDVDAIWKAIGAIAIGSFGSKSDLELAKRRARLSSDAELVLRARREEKALADSIDAHKKAEIAAARAAEEVKAQQANVDDAKAFLAAFDGDEQRLSELGQALTRCIQNAARYQKATGIAGLVAVASAGTASVHMMLGVALVAVFSAVTVMLAVRALLLGRQQRWLSRGKRKIRDTLVGGVGIRAEKVQQAERNLESAQVRWVKAQGDVYTAMAAKAGLEQKQIELSAVEKAKGELRARHSRVAQHYETIIGRGRALHEEMQRSQVRFDELKKQAYTLIDRVKHIEQLRRFERDRAASHEKENQLSAYLDHFFIANEDWARRIPKTALATLASYGIETAADINGNDVEKVPGFGPVRTKLLVDWRESKKAGFRFNPTQGASAKIVAIDRQFAQRRRGEERQLTKIKSQIDMLTEPLEKQRVVLDAEIAQVTAAYGQVLLEEGQVFGKLTAMPPPLRGGGPQPSVGHLRPSPPPIPQQMPHVPRPSPAWVWRGGKPRKKRRSKRRWRP